MDGAGEERPDEVAQRPRHGQSLQLRRVIQQAAQAQPRQVLQRRDAPRHARHEDHGARRHEQASVVVTPRQARYWRLQPSTQPIGPTRRPSSAQLGGRKLAQASPS